MTGCTRFSSTCSPSLIDHVYSTHPEHTKTENVPWGSSDHNLIGVKRKNGLVVEKERMIRKRVFKDFNRMSFNTDLENTNWLELLNMNDIDACVEQFDSKFLRVLEKHCPIRKIQVRKNYTPWYNDEIKDVKASLKWKKVKAQRSCDKKDAKEAEMEAKKLKTLLRRAEEKWKEKQARNGESVPGMSYKQLKEWVGWGGTKQPRQLRDKDGKISSSPVKNANIMNDFYIEKVKKIREDMKDEEFDESRLKHIMSGKTCRFTISEVDIVTVKKALSRLKNSKALGPDDIQADLLKKTSCWTLPVITHIINMMIRQRKFPQKWKISKIIPLLKSALSDLTNPKEYRPVSLLCPMSRLAEMIICDQVVKYLEENGLLHERIHGYRKYHGCTSSIIEVYEEALDAQERQELCSLNLYDQSAAFDLLDHELLLRKMSILGFDEDALGWYKEFLSGRKQYVHLEGADSELADVGTGAPQGSTNGPIVWLIYTIDLPLVIEEDLTTARRDSDLILDALPAAPDRPSRTASDEPNPPQALNTSPIPVPPITASPTPVPCGSASLTPVLLSCSPPVVTLLNPQAQFTALFW